MKLCISGIGILVLLHAIYGQALAEDDVTAYNHVVVVLDASGSMDEQMRHARIKKMDAAKQALIEVLKHVGEKTRIGLIVFSAKNVNDDWLYPLSPVDHEKLRRAINLPVPGYRTPLGAFIKKGADRLLEARARQYGYGSYRLLVVTDGEAGDPMLVERFVPEVIARGIVVDVIGVDMKKTHTLATMVHSYRKADDPKALIQAVAEVFAEVSDVADNSADEETFDELAPIPFELAEAMLTGLAESGNHPIGTRPTAPNSKLAEPLLPAKKHLNAVTHKQKPLSQSAEKNYWGAIIVGLILGISLILIISRKKRS